MLRFWIVVCTLIVSQAVAGDETLSAKVRMVRLSTSNQFDAYCGATNRHVYACTQFVGAQLTARCTAVNEGWSLRPSASYTALVYVVKSEFIPHEFLHIRDMEKAATEYLRRLQWETFRAADDCRRRAKTAQAEFAKVMRSFAADSNAQRQ